MNTNNNFVEIALNYLEQGFSIIPVGRDKRPLIKWEEYQTRKPNKEEIENWAKAFDNPNIAIVTGAISGIVVVDIEKDGDTSYLPPTVIVKTGGGGYHFYYKHPGRHVKNAVRVRDKTDLRGDGGYVLAPPSIHSSGNTYEWLTSPQDADFVELPLWVLQNSSEDKEKTVNWEQFINSENGVGSRNDSAAKLAGKVLYHLPPDLWELSGWATLKEWNNTKNNPRLEDDELRTTWESIRNKEAQRRKITKQLPQLITSQPPSTNPLTFQDLEAVLHKWLLIKDTGIIKVVVGTVIANKLAGDPVWVFLVAAPGGTKTELLRGLNKIDGIYPVSDLTPQTFLSGEKGNKNASLLMRLPSEVILTLKDFTTVLTMHRDKRHAILSQLREIYDGSYKKEFGTGESKEWEGKLGFMAGVTSIIDNHSSIYQTLGERFIQYRTTQPDPIELSMRAINNSGKENNMREEIQDAFLAFIEGIAIPEERIEIPEELKIKIANLATFIVRARSGVIRDGYSTREIELIPEVELPTRLAKQLITLAAAFSLISGGFTDEDYEIIYKIGLDTLPHNRRSVIETLLDSSDFIETASVALKIGYPSNTTRRILEDLHGLKMVLRNSQGKGYADKWMINNQTKKLLEMARPSSHKPKEENLAEYAQSLFDAQIQEEQTISDMSGGL